MTEIPLDAIEENPLRIEARPEVEDLVDSFARHGQLAPIRVRPIKSKPGRFQVVYGNRRLAAARRLRWKKIETTVTDVDDVGALLLALGENLDRRNFTDYEKGMVMERLHILTGKNYAEIAKLIGRSPTFVSQHVAMLRLFPASIGPAEELTKVLLSLTEKHARILSKIDDPMERWNTSKLVVSANLGVREVQRIVSARRENPSARVPNARKEIETLVQDMVEGINVRDLRPCFDLMSPQFTLFSPFPPYLRMNRDAAKKHIYEVVHGMDEFKQEIADLEISTFGKTAYASMYVHFVLGRSGKQIRTVARATVLLMKEDNWKMIHEHWSPINTEEISLLIGSDRHVLQVA